MITFVNLDICTFSISPTLMAQTNVDVSDGKQLNFQPSF